MTSSPASAEPSSVVKDAVAVAGVGLIVRVLLLCLLPPLARSADLFAWLNVAKVLDDGGNPYQLTTALNWPPMWMSILFVLGQVSRLVRVELAWCIQAFLLAVEVGLIVVLLGLLRQLGQGRLARRLLMWGIALNPICVLQTCQHCNFDVLVAFWIALLLSSLLRFWEGGQPSAWLLACLFMGLGAFTKTVPLVLCPMCLVGTSRLDRPTKGLGICLIFGPIAIGVGVLFVLAPAAVWGNVISYRSYAGWFGVTGLLQHFVGDAPLRVYTGTFTAGLVVGWFAIARRLRSLDRLRESDALLAAALALMVLYVLGPGYAPQYVYWTLPILLVSLPMAPRPIRHLLYVAYAVALGTYVYEYAFIPSHGMFATRLLQTRWAVALTHASHLPWTQTVVRLPLFVVYLLLIARMACHLAPLVRGRGDHGQPAN